MADRIYFEQGGTDGPTLVLLHGLGANGTVWDGIRPMLAEGWKGRWIIPDLRGHGRSPHRAPYGFDTYADDVAALLPGEGAVTVVGHSMGGVVAMLLGSNRFGPRVGKAVAFSVKVDWAEEDFARGLAVANAPPKTFDGKDEAIDRYLRVSGLKGLVDPQSPAAAVGVSATEGGFRLAADPQTNAVARTDLEGMARACEAPLVLLCGETDPIARPDSMRRLGAEVAVLPGLGHNLHVEAPAAFWAAIAPALRRP